MNILTSLLTSDRIKFSLRYPQYCESKLFSIKKLTTLLQLNRMNQRTSRRNLSKKTMYPRWTNLWRIEGYSFDKLRYYYILHFHRVNSLFFSCSRTRRYPSSRRTFVSWEACWPVTLSRGTWCSGIRRLSSASGCCPPSRRKPEFLIPSSICTPG